MTSFYFSARYVLLTYSQSGDLSEWSVLDHISSLGAECIIGREDHADGGTHLHVFCDFGRKKQSRRSDFFDVEGHHPNIVPSRGRAGEGWDYATKDGNVVAGGLERPGGGGLPSTPDKWREIIGAESREEFFDLLRELDPKTLVTKWSELNRYADSAYATEHEPYVGPSGLEFELGMVPELARWRGELVATDQLGKCCPPSAPLRGVPEQISARAFCQRGARSRLVTIALRQASGTLGPLFDKCSAD